MTKVWSVKCHLSPVYDGTISSLTSELKKQQHTHTPVPPVNQEVFEPISPDQTSRLLSP